MAPDSKTAVSVSQLTSRIKYYLEQQFFSLWVSGEVSGLSRPSSGHLYFSLKDQHAQIKSVIWRSNAERMRLEFLEDGQEVVCFGNLDVYGPRGVYQLNVRKIEPLGEGALQLAFRKLHAKLDSEGLFDAANKRPLPQIPRRVAIVTSPTGAAIRDFLQVMRRRWSQVELIVVPVLVQGPGSAEQIVDALHAIPDFAERPDVVVLTRGGGSIEDLWSFNDERVCRAIYHCPIPIICGVGHEVDVTLADLVADIRALTPSEAAERLVPDRTAMTELLNTAKRRLGLALKSRFVRAQSELDLIANHPSIQRPLERIRESERELDECGKRLQRLLAAKLEIQQNELHHLVAKLDSLNPLAVLARGFSLTTTPDKSVLVDSRDIEIGDRIQTKLGRGHVFSLVDEIQEPED